jgi:hypothetical protein
MHRLVRPLLGRKGMRLEAVLTKEDIEQLLRRLTPCTISLGDGGKLHLDEPTDVSLIPNSGLHCVCSGQLHWPVLGIHVPVGLRSLQMLLRPEVDVHDGTGVLVFKLHVEHVDVALIPEVIDNRITAKVNEELAKKHVELAWGYARTLSHIFAMPNMLESVTALAMEVKSGTVRLTAQELGFVVELGVDVRRRVDRA